MSMLIMCFSIRDSVMLDLSMSKIIKVILNFDRLAIAI